MKQFVILLVWAIWGALLVACSHDIHENGLENVTYNAVQDVDGNYYDAVQIGDQVWMRTYLCTKHFRDGSEINKGYDYHGSIPRWFSPELSLEADFGDVDALFWNNNEKKAYGLWYNWYAVDDRRGLCPEGWHVPSDAEWDQLEEYVENQWCYNGYSVTKALSSQYGWRCSFNVGTPGCRPEENNVSGFGAVPAGYCSGSSFNYAGITAYFWSSTQYNSDYACYRGLNYYNRFVWRGNGLGNKKDGYSVRCLRD